MFVFLVWTGLFVLVCFVLVWFLLLLLLLLLWFGLFWFGLDCVWLSLIWFGLVFLLGGNGDSFLSFFLSVCFCFVLRLF